MTAFGPCCGSQTTAGVTNVVMLDPRGPVPGQGWGCVVCGLPADGAVAVLCNDCVLAYEDDPKVLRFACRGYATSGQRIPIDELPPGEHRHDEAKHALED